MISIVPLFDKYKEFVFYTILRELYRYKRLALLQILVRVVRLRSRICIILKGSGKGSWKTPAQRAVDNF